MRELRMTNEELIAALKTAWRDEGNLMAQCITRLADVDEKRLYLDVASPSLFDFCVRKIGMSEGEAFRRMTAARLVRKHPQILTALEAQRVHLSSIVLARKLLKSAENPDAILEQIAGKTRREVQKIIACIAPRPDVPSSIRKRPTPKSKPAVQSVPLVFTAACPADAMGGPTDPLMSMADQARAAGMSAAAATAVAATAVAATHVASVSAGERMTEQLVPLAESRHHVQFTASTELREKLERAQLLMRHRNVDGDLAVVVDRALDLLIAKLEKEKLGATSPGEARGASTTPSPRPQPRARRETPPMTSAEARTRPMFPDHDMPEPPPARAPRPGMDRVTAAARREVTRRDQEQCSFLSAEGERCPARDFLEIDHRHPRALGGTSEVSNLRLLCRAHNQHAAEHAFGQAHIARAIDLRRRMSAEHPSSPLPTAGQAKRPVD